MQSGYNCLEMSRSGYCVVIIITVGIRFASIYCIYVADLFYIYDLFKMLTTLLKCTFQNGGQSQSLLFALHLGKMTAIMLSVLTTLVTNDINTVNRVKSDTIDVTLLIPLQVSVQTTSLERTPFVTTNLRQTGKEYFKTPAGNSIKKMLT